MKQSGEKNLEKQEQIIFSFEFDANKKEQREEYQGIDITFWTRESQEKHRVDINVNVYPARGNLKELDGMNVILKRYGKTVGEGFVQGAGLQHLKTWKEEYIEQNSLRGMLQRLRTINFIKIIQ